MLKMLNVPYSSAMSSRVYIKPQIICAPSDSVTSEYASNRLPHRYDQRKYVATMNATVIDAFSPTTSSEALNGRRVSANGCMNVVTSTNARLHRIKPRLAVRSQVSPRSCCVARSTNRPDDHQRAISQVANIRIARERHGEAEIQLVNIPCDLARGPGRAGKCEDHPCRPARRPPMTSRTEAADRREYRSNRPRDVVDHHRGVIAD